MQDQMVAGLIGEIPLGRMGDPEETAAVALFLASDGQQLHDGQRGLRRRRACPGLTTGGAGGVNEQESYSMRPDWIDRLKLPVIAAPMFPGLRPKAGARRLPGRRPSARFRQPMRAPPAELTRGSDEIEQGLAGDGSAAPFGVNIVLSRPARPDPLLDVCVRRKLPLVITSIGDPRDLHAAGAWLGRLDSP